MVNYCSNCGYEIKVGDKFCLNCGKKVQIESPQINAQQQPINQQIYGQTQGYTPVKPKKSNMKIIGAVIGIIVVLIIVLLLVFFVFGKNNNNQNISNFTGKWTVDSIVANGQNMDTSGVSIEFKSDGTFITSSSGNIESGTWEVKNGKLRIISSSQNSDLNFIPGGMNYQFSNNSNTLTVSYSGSYQGVTYSINMVMSKSSSSLDSDSDSEPKNPGIPEIPSEIDSNLIGTWTAKELESDGEIMEITDSIIIFNSNGTYELNFYGTEEIGLWGVKTGKVIAKADTDYSMLFYSDMEYQLSNNKTTLTLSYTFDSDTEPFIIIYTFEKS